MVSTYAARCQIPKIQDICTCIATTSNEITELMVRAVSAHQTGPENHSKCPADCIWSTSTVVNLSVAASQILKIGASSATMTGQIGKWISRRDPAHQTGLETDSKCLAGCSWSTSKVVNVTVVGSQIPKIGDICACSTATMEQIARRMAR